MRLHINVRGTCLYAQWRNVREAILDERRAKKLRAEVELVV